MENRKIWEAKYTRGYSDIPLFSEQYKIKVCGIYGTYDGMYEARNLFLKSHEQNYLLNLDNGTEKISLTSIDLEYYLKNISDGCKILPIHDKLLNPKNECGVMITDILTYNDGHGYGYNNEIGHEYLFGKRITKKEFMTQFFYEKEFEEFNFGTLDIYEYPYSPMKLDDILKEMMKSEKKPMGIRTSIIEDRIDDNR